MIEYYNHRFIVYRKIQVKYKSMIIIQQLYSQRVFYCFIVDNGVRIVNLLNYRPHFIMFILVSVIILNIQNTSFLYCHNITLILKIQINILNIE